MLRCRPRLKRHTKNGTDATGIPLMPQWCERLVMTPRIGLSSRPTAKAMLSHHRSPKVLVLPTYDPQKKKLGHAAGSQRSAAPTRRGVLCQVRSEEHTSE